MYANITPSVYAEKTITSAEEIFSYQNTINLKLPDLEISVSGLLTFSTDYPVLAGDTVLLYSSEYPNGMEEVIASVDGTTTPIECTYTTTSFTVAATVCYLFPQADTALEYPVVSTQAAGTPGEILAYNPPLEWVSSTEVQYVGTSDEDLTIEIGDIVNVYDTLTTPGTPILYAATLTSVTKTGTSAPFTYTLAYATSTFIADKAIAQLDESTPDLFSSVLRTNYPASMNTVTVKFKKVTNSASALTPWFNIGRTITSNAGWEILTPFTVEYAQNI